MRRGRRRSAPPAATSERLTSGIPSFAPRAATMRSQARAISRPPATAKPSIAAISGFFEPRWTMPANPRSPTHGRSPATKALRSMPAQNALPAPVRMPPLSSGASSSSSSAAATPSASGRLTALRASGRLRVMSRTLSRRSVRTGWSFIAAGPYRRAMHQVAEDVWQIALLPRNGVNAYLVGDVVVDAGVKQHAKKVVSAVAGRSIRAHAITHAHGDHVGGSKGVVDALGVPFWCPAGDAADVERGHVTTAESRLRPLLDKGNDFDAVPLARRLQEGD